MAVSQPPDAATPFTEVPWQQFFWELYASFPKVGTATLSGGTVTVPFDGAHTVFVSTANTVDPGYLSTSITPTDFTITSTSATDASTVNWIVL